MHPLSSHGRDRRRLLHAAGANALAALASAAPLTCALAAQDSPWPTRPIKWIVPYLAGTSPDTGARIVAEALGQHLGQPVVIDNRAGAGGNIGARQAAKAPADGYTLLYSGSPMAAAMRMYKAPGYDAFKDFRHVLGMSRSDILLVVHADSGMRSLDDLAARARARPGALDYASGGVGTPSHLGVEMLLSSMDLKASHVPYKGASELVNAVLGQQVAFGAPLFSVAYPHVLAGRLVALAIAGPQRNPKLPQVQTLAELGVAHVNLTSWGGVSVPAATPDAIVQRLRTALQEVLQQPRVVALMEQEGGKVAITSAEAYAKGFEREMQFTETMMRRMGLQPI
jgi:tripartite-type tricarboxylate transporter receptor subunit TctC